MGGSTLAHNLHSSRETWWFRFSLNTPKLRNENKWCVDVTVIDFSISIKNMFSEKQLMFGVRQQNDSSSL